MQATLQESAGVLLVARPRGLVGGAITRADRLVERASGDAALARSESGRLPCKLPWSIHIPGCTTPTPTPPIAGQTPFALVAYMAGVIAAHEEDEDEGYDHPGDDTNDGGDGARVHSVFTFYTTPTALTMLRVSRELIHSNTVIQ